MRTNKTRINKLEQARQNSGAVKRIYVYKEHEDAGILDGVRMPLTEWDKIKTDADLTLVIRYASGAIKDE